MTLVVVGGGKADGLVTRRFFIFVVILVVMHQLGVAMFRAFGALCRSETVANTFGSFFFLSIMILGGTRPDLSWQSRRCHNSANIG